MATAVTATRTAASTATAVTAPRPAASPKATAATAPRTAAPTSEVKVGMRISADEGVTGTVRFVGNTHFAPGVWVGVEFDKPIETGNDGSEEGISLFRCPPGHGGFFPLPRIRGAIRAGTDPPVTGTMSPSKPGMVAPEEDDTWYEWIFGSEDDPKATTDVRPGATPGARPAAPPGATPGDRLGATTTPAATAGATPLGATAGSTRSRAPRRPPAPPEKGLELLLEKKPFLSPEGGSSHHPGVSWVTLARAKMKEGKSDDAKLYLQRALGHVIADEQQIAAAFRRFDANSSGQIDRNELGRMCAYLGWSEDAINGMDGDKDGAITLQEFQNFIGRAGGIQAMFEQRRKRVQAATQGGGKAMAQVNVGDRVRSYFNVKGQKSQAWREAQVLEVRVKDCPAAPGDGVLLEFGNFDKTTASGKRVDVGAAADSKDWRARQVVPHSWILGGPGQAEVVHALREVGILDWQQGFFTSIFPKSELDAMAKLTSCQRAALAQVRKISTPLHAQALDEMKERFKNAGFDELDLMSTLDWVQDLAPICVHVSIDRTGHFLENDGFYRNQFETKSSGGAIDSGNAIRIGWEKELFGGTYDSSKAFERPKYGALSVMNDYRGVTSAYQYGDSYMVMKDLRLRTTFAATDSGGIAGNRLGVLDKYAHVLREYNETELQELVKVVKGQAVEKAKVRPERLRGPSADPRMAWVTVGYPKYKQKTGKYYFEVELAEGCVAPQVGLASSGFETSPQGVISNRGVGDDENGWAADGLHCAKWNAGTTEPWNVSWPSDGRALTEKITVGVAVDLDDRRMWFSLNGMYDPDPVFKDLPEGRTFFPAISLQGCGSFKFGSSSKFSGKSFERWPGLPQGIATMDTPQVGNSQTLCIYKEVQLHGEVSLKQNVVRLVANEKYRNVSKQDRSWSLTVRGSGNFNGSFNPAGIRNQRQFYKNTTGAILYWSAEANRWRMNDKDDLETWCFESADASQDPTGTSWVVPLEMRGTISEDAFRKALGAAGGLDAEKTNKLVSTLLQKDSSGKSLICKVSPNTSLEAEWLKFKSENGPSASEIWSKAVEEQQKIALEDMGLPKDLAVIMTQHPYKKETDRWERDVKIKGAKRLAVQFHKKCCTFDGCANLKIFPEPLNLAAGACIGISTFQGWISATVDKDLEQGVFLAHLDRHILEHKPGFNTMLSGSEKSVAMVKEQPTEIRVTYQADKKLNSEIKDFQLDKTYPLTPIRLGDLISKGPAQEAGVKKGWFLDINMTCYGVSYEQTQKLLMTKLPGETEGEYQVVAIDSDKPYKLTGRFFADKSTAKAYFDSLSKEKTAALLEDGKVSSVGDHKCGEKAENEKVILAWAKTQVLESLRPTKHSDDLLTQYCWMTFGAPSLKKSSGKYYYEVKLGDNMSAPQIGWCTEGFTTTEGGSFNGVGDDEHGWGADGIRNLKWNDGGNSSSEWERCWRKDDVLGCAIDVTGGKMTWSLNGKWVESAAMTFEAKGRSFYPALSGEMDFTFAFTAASWKFSPPDSSFQPLLPADAGCGTFDKTQSKHHPGGQDVDLQDVYNRIDWFHRRLQLLLTSSDLTLVFIDSIACKRLREAAVNYKEDQAVESEISSSGGFFSSEGQVYINGFSAATGPAQALGVRCGWRLVLDKTLKKNPGKLKDIKSEEELSKNPQALCTLKGVTLCFESTQPDDGAMFTGYGSSPDGWQQYKFSAEGSGLKFVWESDGDGGPEERWGVFAVVLPENDSTKALSYEDMDKLVARWDEVTLRANGAEPPVVSRDGWDETRLRALCARHGWEFEWMSEDGEFRRRAGEVPAAKADESSTTMKMAASADSAIPDGYQPL